MAGPGGIPCWGAGGLPPPVRDPPGSVGPPPPIAVGGVPAYRERCRCARAGRADGGQTRGRAGGQGSATTGPMSPASQLPLCCSIHTDTPKVPLSSASLLLRHVTMPCCIAAVFLTLAEQSDTLQVMKFIL